MKVKDVYMSGRKVNINKGDLARVWHDPWVDNGILRERFPVLYDICQDQDCTVASFVDNDYNLPFRRRLFGELEEQWNWMVCEAKKMPLNENPDAISWSLNSGGRFTTKSVYKWLERDLSGRNYKWVWKAAIPLKIKIFLWQLFQDAVLTRDNMRRRNWPGNPVCSFCTNVETANHLFFACPLARTVWGVLGLTVGASCAPRSIWQSLAWMYNLLPGGKKFYMMIIAAVCWGIWCLRNKTTFDKYNARSPLEAVFTACSFMLYWAGLLKEDDRRKFQDGVKRLAHVAAALADKPYARGRLLLGDEDGIQIG